MKSRADEAREQMIERLKRAAGYREGAVLISRSGRQLIIVPYVLMPHVAENMGNEFLDP